MLQTFASLLASLQAIDHLFYFILHVHGLETCVIAVLTNTCCNFTNLLVSGYLLFALTADYLRFSSIVRISWRFGDNFVYSKVLTYCMCICQYPLYCFTTMFTFYVLIFMLNFAGQELHFFDIYVIQNCITCYCIKISKLLLLSLAQNKIDG